MQKVLNTLLNKTGDKTKWECLDTKGIIIHNAVFAGGNTSSGSAKVYANATTVFGNATASIHDVYHRDLITVGTGHTGGLYGDGNLTFVDGYRGLNITNYGTDYYTISGNREISIEDYHKLDDREAAYYELRYICIQDCRDKEGTDYTKGTDDGKTKPSVMNADDLLALFTNNDGTPFIYNGVPMTELDSDGNRIPNHNYWKENGVCTIYAGRPMNTIQRADFCGVFGSRMVMQGAQYHSTSNTLLLTLIRPHVPYQRGKQQMNKRKLRMIISSTKDIKISTKPFTAIISVFTTL